MLKRVSGKLFQKILTIWKSPNPSILTGIYVLLLAFLGVVIPEFFTAENADRFSFGDPFKRKGFSVAVFTYCMIACGYLLGKHVGYIRGKKYAGPITQQEAERYAKAVSMGFSNRNRRG